MAVTALRPCLLSSSLLRFADLVPMGGNPVVVAPLASDTELFLLVNMSLPVARACSQNVSDAESPSPFPCSNRRLRFVCSQMER
jgi:hypothetical protein